MTPRVVLGMSLAAAVTLAACSHENAAARSTGARESAPATANAATGRVRGVVTLRGAIPEARDERVLQDMGTCGSTVGVTRLALGPSRGIAHAFVYLSGVKATGELRPRAAVEVKQEGCEYGPHAATLGVGGSLAIVNNDPILHNVHGQESTPDGLQTVFNLAQPVRGSRSTVPTLFNKPGIVALSCEAGHPWMTAYLLVADHPFVATSGASGEFVIDRVTPGSYPATMWHEGVRLQRVLRALQCYEYEAPYEETRTIDVKAGEETVVNFEVELRDLPTGTGD